ncbi:MAG: heavy metal translocating P-type ATPase [Desulfobacterales bacterium]|nr:heavy metal translocating P-type ATPase [Desulfobacterales bacterium]MDX2511227.1 heavy metal translocating P-type ATPase [Desulfobacterales bacterium]
MPVGSGLSIGRNTVLIYLHLYRQLCLKDMVVMHKATCDLCGLSLRHGAVTAVISEKPMQFCCFGCKQVYEMLLAASGDLGPDAFRETEIFKRCVAAGIIPESMEDLERKVLSKKPDKDHPPNRTAKIDTDAPVSEMDSGLWLDLIVSGMWCPACAWVVEETLIKEPGVKQAKCQFTTDRVKLQYNPVLTSPQYLMDAIEKIGYHGSPAEDGQKRPESRREFIRLGISAFLTMNVMMLSFALYTGFFTQLSADAIHHLTWPIVVMGSAVFIYGGAPIHRKAISGLSAASPGMETLISMGAGSAFFYSLFNWLTGSIHLYFDTASMLITLVLVGKTIEQHAKDRINTQINRFFELQPSKVRICTEKYPEGRYVDAGQLSSRDIFRVEAGETVPADGRILKGDARLDESTLTGEAKPIHKQKGALLNSGTTVISGSLRVSAHAVGKDSLVGQLISVMEASLDNKSHMEDITDKALKYFVPTIVLLSIGTAAVCLGMGFSVQHAIIRAVTVMVISCPCALGVAIPLARVAGISLAGKNGILVHHFSAFEKIRNVNAFVFDKTGTLTRGGWELMQTELLNGWPVEKVLSLAAGLEAHSFHYAGEAIVHAARKRNIAPATTTRVTETDNGISGVIDNNLVKIGSLNFLSGDTHDTLSYHGDAETEKTSAISTVHMSVGGKPCALFHFGDVVRASSKIVIRHLKERGMKLALISGDGQQTTQKIGNIVGIPECQGGMQPENKSEFINTLREQGYCVAMVGDGVNDVPALASADLGIAVHSGHRIGMEASGITLMGNDPAQILTFSELASHVSRTIQQNLIFTFLYNLISIPIAMSGLLNPLVAVSAMLMSSLSVTGNTLYLTRRVSKQKRSRDMQEV